MKYDGMLIASGELLSLSGPVPSYSSFVVPAPSFVETSKAEDTKTEQGYVPPEIQIRDMLRAGTAIDATRRGRFDSELYPDGELDIEIALDPFRDQGADIVDLVRQATLVGSRLREQDAAARKAAAELEAARAASKREALSASLVGKTSQEIDALLKAAAS